MTPPQTDPSGSAGLEVAFTPGPHKADGKNTTTEVGGFNLIWGDGELLAYVARDGDAALYAAASDLYRELGVALEDLWAERHSHQDRISFEREFASGFAALSRAGKSS